jgi:hypothetical protein
LAAPCSFDDNDADADADDDNGGVVVDTLASDEPASRVRWSLAGVFGFSAGSAGVTSALGAPSAAGDVRVGASGTASCFCCSRCTGDGVRVPLTSNGNVLTAVSKAVAVFGSVVVAEAAPVTEAVLRERPSRMLRGRGRLVHRSRRFPTAPALRSRYLPRFVVAGARASSPFRSAVPVPAVGSSAFAADLFAVAGREINDDHASLASSLTFSRNCRRARLGDAFASTRR